MLPAPQAVLEAEEQRGRFAATAADLKLALSGLQASPGMAWVCRPQARLASSWLCLKRCMSPCSAQPSHACNPGPPAHPPLHHPHPLCRRCTRWRRQMWQRTLRLCSASWRRCASAAACSRSSSRRRCWRWGEAAVAAAEGGRVACCLPASFGVITTPTGRTATQRGCCRWCMRLPAKPDGLVSWHARPAPPPSVHCCRAGCGAALHGSAS